MGANVRGQVTVRQQNDRMLQLTGIQAGTCLMPPGGTTVSGTGSYIDSIVVFPVAITTVGSCLVQLSDQIGVGTVQLFPNLWAPTTTMMNPLQYQIFLGVTSQMGPWRISLAGGVGVTVIGRFEK